jgi:hypothetical protein
MATIPLSIQISPSYAGQTIGYKVLNLDRTEYSAYTNANVVDLGSGFFAVAGGINVPDAGSYIQILENDQTTLITETGSDPVSAANLVVPGMPGVTPGNPVPGVDFTLMRGDTDSFAIENVDVQAGDLFIVTAKAVDGVDKWYDMLDVDATFQVVMTGLHVLNGIDVTLTRESEATLIADEAQDTVFVVFQPSALREFPLGRLVFDCQRQRGSDVQTVTWGIIEVLGDVTRRIA